MSGRTSGLIQPRKVPLSGLFGLRLSSMGERLVFRSRRVPANGCWSPRSLRTATGSWRRRSDGVRVNAPAGQRSRLRRDHSDALAEQQFPCGHCLPGWPERKRPGDSAWTQAAQGVTTGMSGLTAGPWAGSSYLSGLEWLVALTTPTAPECGWSSDRRIRPGVGAPRACTRYGGLAETENCVIAVADRVPACQRGELRLEVPPSREFA